MAPPPLGPAEMTGAPPAASGNDVTEAPASRRPEANLPASSAEEEASPIVASMAPFAASAVPAVENPAGVDKAVPASGHSLTLKLAEPSWIEITSADGEKLEYGLLQAGVERTYTSEKPISVRIGNARGAEIVADGQTVDLAPFQRANVANLRVFAEGKLASRIDS